MGMPVESELVVDATRYGSASSSLAASTKTFDLGDSYRRIKMWLQAGSPACTVGFNPNNKGLDLDASMVWIEDFDKWGCRYVYARGASAGGRLNVMGIRKAIE